MELFLGIYCLFGRKPLGFGWNLLSFGGARAWGPGHFFAVPQTPKVALAGHKEEGKKKDTPAPLWSGAYTRRVGSERR